MRLNRFPLQYIFGVFCIAWIILSGSVYDPLVANILRGVGVILVIIGVGGRAYATLFIGGMKNSGSDGNSFIDYGIYSITRNPLYLFSFVGFVGILLLKAQISFVIVGAIVFLWIYRMTILSEEEFLSGRFGDKYKKFLSSAPRFFPDFSKYHCTESIEVRIKFLHKELRRAIFWLIGVLVIVLVEVLHSYEILPILVKVM